MTHTNDKNTLAEYPQFQPVLAAVGEIVLNWNSAEGALRAIIAALCDRHPGALLLTANLGSVGLEETLRAFSNEFLEGELKDAIQHGLKHLDIVREYRNYYVHGFSSLATLEGLPALSTEMHTAKNRLSIYQEFIGLPEIKSAADICYRLSYYLACIHLHIFESKSAVISAQAQPQALPERSPLPDRLKKTRRFLLDEMPRPLKPFG